MKRATGERGSWFASVDGRRLPCIHRFRLRGMRYIDPFDRHEGDPKVREFIDAIVSGKQAILTDGTPTIDAEGKVVGVERTSYIGIFRLDDIQYDRAGGLSMRLVERLESLE